MGSTMRLGSRRTLFQTPDCVTSKLYVTYLLPTLKSTLENRTRTSMHVRCKFKVYMLLSTIKKSNHKLTFLPLFRVSFLLASTLTCGYAIPSADC